MIRIVLCVMVVCASTVLSSTFDYTISSGYSSDIFKLNNQSLLVEGGGVERIEAYQDSYVKINSTDKYIRNTSGINSVQIHDSSSLDFCGGQVGASVWAYGSSYINVYGGKMYTLISDEYSTVSMSGGKASTLYVLGNSSTILSGGTINDILNNQFVPLDEKISFNILCKTWDWDEDNNILSGYWADDSVFSIRLIDTKWANGDVYRLIDQIDFTIVPEPISILLLSLGGIIVRKKNIARVYL